MQLDIYSRDPAQVGTIGRLVYEALGGLTGWMGATRIQGAWLAGARDMDEPEVDLFRRVQDWQIRVLG